MTRFLVLFALAIAAGALSFFAYSEYQERGEAVEVADTSELAWLRTGFSLSEEDFEKVERLHAEFRPVCDALCNRVIEIQKDLDEAILSSDGLTEELEAELAEFARVQEECNRYMLQHAYAVAAILPPAERPRYLDGVREQITLHGHGQ